MRNVPVWIMPLMIILYIFPRFVTSNVEHSRTFSQHCTLDWIFLPLSLFLNESCLLGCFITARDFLAGYTSLAPPSCLSFSFSFGSHTSYPVTPPPPSSWPPLFYVMTSINRGLWRPGHHSQLRGQIVTLFFSCCVKLKKKFEICSTFRVVTYGRKILLTFQYS